MSKTFVDLVIDGTADIADVDDYVEKWHDSQSRESLPAFLGLNKREYALWVSNPSTLAVTIKRKEDKLKKVISSLLDKCISKAYSNLYTVIYENDIKALKKDAEYLLNGYGQKHLTKSAEVARSLLKVKSPEPTVLDIVDGVKNRINKMVKV